MSAFIQKQKRYPEEARKAGVEGTVTIRYTIDYQGAVVKTKIISGIGHGCDKEATRLVKLLRFEVPKSRKLKVQFHKTIHIHFKLPTKRGKINTVKYHLSPSKKINEKEPSKSYNYQIKV